MREQIHTIPVNEAFESQDECPFCFLERNAERSAIRYVAGPGASYMEPDVRAATDSAGFCREHMQKLYTFGNSLGSALMLQTHMVGLLREWENALDDYEIPEKRPLFGKKKTADSHPYWGKLQQRVDSCYLCDKINYNMERYYLTFFALTKEPEFRAKVENGKGFCLRHFAQLMPLAEDNLPNSQREWFYPTAIRVTRQNLERVKGDLDWFIAKFDYRNATAPWKNSQDAVPRAMQKLEGLHPADKPYKMD